SPVPVRQEDVVVEKEAGIHFEEPGRWMKGAVAERARAVVRDRIGNRAPALSDERVVVSLVLFFELRASQPDVLTSYDLGSRPAGVSGSAARYLLQLRLLRRLHAGHRADGRAVGNARHNRERAHHTDDESNLACTHRHLLVRRVSRDDDARTMAWTCAVR